jgi:molybdopterin-guanine dinucleotide biosynthesis protein A
MKNTAGVILAGGKSSRFGADKALVRFNDKPLVSSIYNELILTTNYVCLISDNIGKYEFLNIPVHEDIIEGAGPIGGIYTALNVTAGDWYFITPCDIVHFSRNIVTTLLDNKYDYEAAVYSIAGEIQPLPLLIRRNTVKKILPYLRNENLSMKGFLDICNKTVIPAEYYFDPEILRSCNTKEEFLKLSREKSIFVY